MSSRLLRSLGLAACAVGVTALTGCDVGYGANFGYPNNPPLPPGATVTAQAKGWYDDDPMRGREVVIDIGSAWQAELVEFYRKRFPSTAGWRQGTPEPDVGGGHLLCLVRHSERFDEYVEIYPYGRRFKSGGPRMILLAADGVGNREIARVAASPTTVIQWRARYEEFGLAGLEDQERSGRLRELAHAAIVTATLTAPPKKLGVTQWPTRLLGQLKIGTTTLFAALEIATGKVTAVLKPKHRHQKFLACLKHIERTYRDAVDEHGQPLVLHLVMDNYAAHKHKNFRDWLEVNPRLKVHFTPTHASWMKLVEVWFGLVERQAVRRGVFKSVPDLNAKLRAYIEGWNQRAHPLVWTKTAEEILQKANRPTTSNPRH